MYNSSLIYDIFSIPKLLERKRLMNKVLMKAFYFAVKIVNKG